MKMFACSEITLQKMTQSPFLRQYNNEENMNTSLRMQHYMEMCLFVMYYGRTILY